MLHTCEWFLVTGFPERSSFQTSVYIKTTWSICKFNYHLQTIMVSVLTLQWRLWDECEWSKSDIEIESKFRNPYYEIQLAI